MTGSPDHAPSLPAGVWATWSEGNGSGKEVSAGGKARTLWLRWRGSEAWPEGELVHWAGLRMLCERQEERTALVATLTTDARPEPLRLTLPASAIFPAPRHDLVLRYAGHKVELFLDGVLVDEEWPMGAAGASDGRLSIGAGFQARVERAAAWNRALTDDEVLQLSGGREGVAERERQILGPPLPVGQYWLPRGLNTHVGDCMPFFHAGRFHLFYLLDRHNHRSKWGLGAHQWAHVSTTDLVNWEEHPLAIPLTQESEGSICTGSVLFHAGTYHAFHSVRMADGSASPLCVATGTDGIHFTKQPPLACLTAPYLPVPARDPVVFHEKATGLFHMLVTTALANPPVPGRGGCLAHLVSRDLRKWEQREPFMVPGYPGDPECPDYFEWRGWHYLIFSHQGIAHYRLSRQPLGPWQKPDRDTFDGPELMVMKTAAYTGDRRLGVAFTPRARELYAGRVVFRELIQRADGTLTTQWPAEMKPLAVGP